MPIISEMISSREQRGKVIDLVYHITGTDDDVVVASYLLANTPATYRGFIRDAYPTITPIDPDTITGTGRWLCAVRYVEADSADVVASEIGSIRIRGTTKGGTQHVEVSINTIYADAVAGDTATVSDNGGAINTNSNGEEVGGVDIYAPSFSFTVVKVFSPGGLPTLNDIYSLGSTVNEFAFEVTDTVTGLHLSFAAGECLFLGADFGNVRVDGGVEFSYDFIASGNRTDIEIGTITNIVKDGQDYLWVKYKSKKVDGIKDMTQIPTAIYVEQMYYLADWTGLV